MSRTEMNDPPDTDSATDAEIEVQRRSAIKAGIFGYFADQYSIILPVIALGPALMYFLAADISTTQRALALNAVFAATLLGRPLGSLILAPLADRIGRRKVTIISLFGFGTVTLSIALLPGYEQIGGWAIALLVALRLVDGIFLAGEYSAAVPLAMEWSRKEKRGFLSGAITANNPLAYTALAAIVLLLLSIMPSAGIDSAYVQWGWRIPFVLGAAFAFAMAIYSIRYVVDPDGPPTRSVHPLVALTRGSARRDLGQALLMMTGVWLAIQPTLFVLPGLLSTHVGLSPRVTAGTLMVAQFVVALAYLGVGQLSQRIGRRTFYMAMGPVVAVLGSVFFGLAVSSGDQHITVTFLFVLGALLATSPLFAPIAAYLTERFTGSHRASGYGVAYSLALVIPSFYGVYIQWFSHWVAPEYAPIGLMLIAGVLITAGAAIGPETRDVDM